MKPFWIYMLQCADGSYYIGHTDNLERRLGEHEQGILKGYTSTRLPVRLVWCDSFVTRQEALEREKQVKGWSRAKKKALIRENWEEIKRLAKRRPSTSSGRTGNHD